MHCPFCNEEDTKVVDSRLFAQGAQVKRRRECSQCNERFTTYESAELNMPRVIKRDGSRMAFAEDKLRAGIHKSLEKRPVEMDKIEELIMHIKQQMRTCGEREISSQKLGEWVMHALKDLDDVAYVRFASVYRRFQDVNAFREAISRIEKERLEEAHG